MTEFDRQRLQVFHVGEEYLFTTYFERDALFESLQQYYNEDAYRFEVPDREFESVRERLRESYYEPHVIEDLEPYCVVKERYTEHADILRNAVVHWQRRGHNFFLLEDQLAVKSALEDGAREVTETDLAMGL